MRAALACLALALSACTVGPDHQPPRLELADRFRLAPVSPAAPLEPERLERWWLLLRDPVLDGLMERALAANTDLATAEARLRQSRGSVDAARATLLPRVDAQGLASNERLSQRGRVQAPGSPQFRIFDATFDAAWELDLFGGSRRGVEAARADLGAALADAFASRVTLASEVARQYVALRALQERAVLAEDNIAAQADYAGLMRQRFRAGLISELDVAQAEALLAELRAATPTLAVGIEERRNALAVLLGEAPERLASELAAPGRIPAAPDMPALGVPADLLRRRPDVLRAERRVAAASARIGQELAEYYPRVSLTGSMGWQARSLSDFATGPARLWTIGPSVTWRLLDFGRIEAAVERARGAEQVSLAEWRAAVLTALEEVDTGVARLNGRGREVAARQASVAAQIRARDIARERFTRGLSEFMPVLDAERRSNDARDAAIRAREAQTDAAVRLLKALGGGWPAAN